MTFQKYIKNFFPLSVIESIVSTLDLPHGFDRSIRVHLQTIRSPKFAFNIKKSIVIMAQKLNGSIDQLVKSVGNLTESVVALQTSVDELKADTAKKFKELKDSREDDLKRITGRVATIGNQISYFRETVCGCVTEQVPEKVQY